VSKELAYILPILILALFGFAFPHCENALFLITLCGIDSYIHSGSSEIGFVFSKNIVIGQLVCATFASDGITFFDRITRLRRGFVGQAGLTRLFINY